MAKVTIPTRRTVTRKHKRAWTYEVTVRVPTQRDAKLIERVAAHCRMWKQRSRFYSTRARRKVRTR